MNYILQVRLLFVCSLIFLFTAISCRDEGKKEIILGWEGKHVKTILVPRQLLDGSSAKAITENLHVRLAAPGSPAIIGNYYPHGDYIAFEPAIPFTKGLKYELEYKGSKLKEIVIPAPEGKSPPKVTGIYPNEDTLPENLLKIYIGFSEQMQEGVSAQHVFLVKDNADTLSNVFLDLELWNHDRTMLTLWLNPGRIKRDLIPNREEGPPLVPGAHYRVSVKYGWPDAFGDSIIYSTQKNFVTAARDTISPDTDNWTIKTPKAGTLDPLIVNFKEPLDLVAKNALYILDGDTRMQPGSINLANDERTWIFTPFTEWRKGRYALMIEPRIEDLAGNNLDRLFDRDLTKPEAKTQPQGPKDHEKQFEIR